MEAYAQRVREVIEKAKSEGCPHVGQLPPERFDCISCDDNARDCNCHDSMGVFCRECNKMLSTECDDVRTAYSLVRDHKLSSERKKK